MARVRTRVLCLLFVSGACALAYQATWLRELRLVFGTSTAASAAVTAVFMGGLGAGGALFARMAERSKNPLRLYARLELAVAGAAAATPLLGWAARRVYFALGGSVLLGGWGATAARLALAALVLATPTILMGGTLPAASRAVAGADDGARRRVAGIYAANTAGAVVGVLATTLFLIEAFGVRSCLFVSSLVNAIVGVVALTWSRTASAPKKKTRGRDEPSLPHRDDDPPRAATPRWLPPAAAALSGATFMLMELVWYRMLAPLLGGTSYTYGLVLAVALAGIGTGAGLYARTSLAKPSLATFAVVCSLEALAIAVPFALGDRLAIVSLLLRPAIASGFGASIAVWTFLSLVVVFPTAVVAGAQFPLVVALYGTGERRVARDVGRAYLANTLGAIVGSLAGGFGLIPALSATGCWRACVYTLAGASLLVLYVARRAAPRPDAGLRGRAPLAIAASAVLLVFADGPTAAWRHSGIGAGRADSVPTNAGDLESFVRETRARQLWEVDGLESSIALHGGSGLTMLVNGKSDGHVILDAPTQVMGGLLGALLHDNPKRALVIGLGTGETAGWLARVPSIERVDVVELEPRVVEIARAASSANEGVLENPRVTIRFADAREVIQVSRETYDVVFSEPSNPYRAGVSSLYTTEFYEAVARRLDSGGVFIQWLQAYDVGDAAVATTLVTLRKTFDEVSVWQSMHGDFLIVGRRERKEIDVDRLRERVASEPFARALRIAWHTASAEGVLARHAAGPGFADALVERGIGVVNRDDKNVLEFEFARRLGEGSRREATGPALRSAALALRVGGARVTGRLDVQQLLHETWLFALVNEQGFDPVVATSPPPLKPWGEAMELFRIDRAAAFRAWTGLGQEPKSYYEALVVAHAAARAGDPRAPELISRVERETDRELLRALHGARSEGQDVLEAVQSIARAVGNLRSDPWGFPVAIDDILDAAVDIAPASAESAKRLYDALDPPFAASIADTARLVARARIGRSIDARACASAFSHLEPPPMKRDVLALRASCYREAHDPRADQAEAELLRFEVWSVPFAPLRPVTEAAARP